MESKARTAVEKFFEAVNRRDFQAMGALVAESITWTEPFMESKVGTGKKAYLKDARSFVKSIPDATFTVGNIVADGDKAAFEMTIERKESGSRVTFALFLEVNPAGQWHRLREYYDTKTTAEKLGFE